MAKADHTITPAALTREEAAAYCGSLALAIFDRMVAEGYLPAPRMIPGTRRLIWLRREIDLALAELPARGLGAGRPLEELACDAVFGSRA